MGDFYFSHSLQESPIRLNLSSVKNIWMESGETQKNKKVLFSLCYLASSLFRNLHSVWNVPPSSKLLHFFFQFPPHLPTSTHWQTLAFFSPQAPPLTLTGSSIPSSPPLHPFFPFSSPLRFPFLSLHYGLLTSTSTPTKELLCPSYTN